MAPTEPTPATQADLRAALAEALEESEFPTQASAAADSWESWDGAGAGAAEGGLEATASEDIAGGGREDGAGRGGLALAQEFLGFAGGDDFRHGEKKPPQAGGW